MVSTVAPYRYADGRGRRGDRRSAERICRRAESTPSPSPARRRWSGCSPRPIPHRVRAALASTKVAAVGPVVASTLERHGVVIAATPESAWFLKPLTTALS